MEKEEREEKKEASPTWACGKKNESILCQLKFTEVVFIQESLILHLIFILGLCVFFVCSLIEHLSICALRTFLNQRAHAMDQVVARICIYKYLMS